MNSKAQAGLEYLMTYGWALIIIATVIGVLVLVASTPSQEMTFSSSDPGKIMVKGSSVTGDQAEVLLQNITGGNMTVTGVALGGGFSGCKLNDEEFISDAAINPPINIPAGGNLYFTEITYNGISEGTIEINYNDFAGLSQSVTVTGHGGSTTGGGGGGSLLEDGEACAAGSECDSTYCVDSVCCDTTCTGSTCQTCGSLSSVEPGTCGYVTSGDPDGDCTTGSSYLDGCRASNCSGSGYSCGVISSGDGGCPTCKRCTDSDIVCENYAEHTNDSGCSDPDYCIRGRCAWDPVWETYYDDDDDCSYFCPTDGYTNYSQMRCVCDPTIISGFWYNMDFCEDACSDIGEDFMQTDCECWS